MLGENWLIFALDPKLKLDTETLLLHSGPKFLCFVVVFYKYFWFWYETKIVSEKVYAGIWPVLEIIPLKESYKSHCTEYFRKKALENNRDKILAKIPRFKRAIMEVNYTVYLYKNQPNQGKYTTVKPQKRPLARFYFYL